MDFVGGCFAGAIGVVACHPFDVIKIRQQSALNSSQTIPSNGVIGSLLRVSRTESVRGLFKGMASPLVGNTLVYGLLFGVNEALLNLSLFNKDKISHHVCSGFLSGMIQTVIGSPMELSKIRLQVQGIGIDYQRNSNYKRRYRDSISCLRVIACEEGGLRGIYRGLPLTIARDAPGFAVWMALYESLKKFQPKSNSNVVLLTHSFIAGGLCGCAGWLVVYPIDTIKTEYQRNPAYKTYREVLRNYASFSSLFSGISACMWRSMAQTSTMFFTLELFRLFVY